MSSRSRKRRSEVRALKVKQIDDFGGPQPHRITSSNAHRIMQWVLFGKAADKEAMFDLFPVPPTNRQSHG